MLHLVQPLLKDGAVLFRLLHEAGVAGTLEHLPAAVRDILIQRCSHHRSAYVPGSAADKARLTDLSQPVRVLKSRQVSKGLILVRSPAVEIRLSTCAFGAAEALRGILINAYDKLLKVVLVGAEIAWILPVSACFRTADSLLVLQRCCSLAQRELDACPDDRMSDFTPSGWWSMT